MKNLLLTGAIGLLVLSISGCVTTPHDRSDRNRGYQKNYPAHYDRQQRNLGHKKPHHVKHAKQEQKQNNWRKQNKRAYQNKDYPGNRYGNDRRYDNR